MRRALLYSLVFTIFLLTDKLSAQVYDIYPGNEWEYSIENSPCSPMNDLKRYVRDSLNTTGLIIIKSGKIILEFGDTKEISYSASTRKSILSMLYGKYVADGTINLQSTLEELQIDDINPLTKEEKQATIDQIMNSRSGVYLPASNSGSGYNMPKRGQYKPGTHFYYNNWDFNVAGTIFEQQTGLNIYEAFEKDIAIPLNFQDFELKNHQKSGDSSKSSHLAYYFHLSTRDMARLGYLMLRNGKWKDEQIIPAEWVKRTTTEVSRTDDRGLLKGYSYMWWLYSDSDQELLEGAYTATGAYGQFITIIPKMDIVIAHKTKSAYERRTSKKDYDTFILKLVESGISNSLNSESINYDHFTGIYIDDSNGKPFFVFEIFIDNNELKCKGPISPEPVVIEICNANKGIFISPFSGSPFSGIPPAEFKRDKNGIITGFQLGNNFIKKN